MLPARDRVAGLPELKGLTVAQLEQVFLDLGQKKYRAQQVYDALYVHRIPDVHGMTTLPADLRALLHERFRTSSVELESLQHSEDGTKKFLFALHDGRVIESVLIPSEMVEADGKPRRRTLCISTQVGCNLGCTFCATATMKLARNLSAGEIIDQFLQAQLHSEQPITNVVFMGMGEPMNNYDNVMQATSILNDQRTLMVAPRRTTLSTAGVLPGIVRMADEGRIIKLALSLHATTQETRVKLMPIAKKWPLDQVLETLDYYYKKTRKSVTYEYIVFKGLNDTLDDARRLGRMARRLPTKVNLIPFHEIDFTHPTGFSAELKPASPERFQWFIDRLREEDVRVLVRSSSGLDIDAACGQLALSAS
ncbi:MAG: 23S rRNA (adenine(2503)-C(2))-methyltransferase RlmN [Bradyrhizobiaceae bacterium]|nr:23S rRNA (adenine(2503)-C(2))-methyltransferase RlmN [Bradyrhizobiaceae bacterium]